MKRLLADIVSVVGARYVFYVGLLAMTGLMEAVSLAAVVPLLTAVGVGSADAGPGGAIGRLVLTALAVAGVSPTPAAICVVVVAALAASTSMFLAQSYLGANLQTMYVYRWQQRLASSIFGARWDYFQQRRQGDLVNALATEAQRLGGAFYQLGLLLTGVIHATLFLLIAASLSSAATGVVMAGGAVLFVVTRPLVRRSYEYGTGITQESAMLQSLAGELVSGAKLVKATATESEAVRLLTGSANRLRRHVLANAFDVQVIKGVFDFGAAAIGAAILVTSQTVLGSDPAVTLVVLAIFIRLMPKLTSIQHGLQSLSFVTPSVEVIQALARDAESQGEVASAGSLPEGLRHGPISVDLRNVRVRYGDVEALGGVSLEVQAGSCVALAGGSGAGKSSLVDAVLGLVAVSGGDVSLNRIPLAELPLPALRRRIGYMGQETVLYNASIRDNVVWGRSGCTSDEFDTAIRVAGAEAFIARLSDGSDTTVGDRGGLLSGGERQRLGLARAALGAPGLLILDEATSALDAESERVVTNAVAALRGHTTVIIIAHRLSSLRIADTICVMEEGRIVEQGSWDELVGRRGRFHALWTLQHAEERGASVTEKAI